MKRNRPLSLSLTDKALLFFFASLSLAEDSLNNLATPRSVMRAVYSQYPDYFGSDKTNTVARIFYRLFARRFIKKVGKERQRQVKLTTEGFSYLYRKFPQLRLKEKASDGYWRIVVYDVEEANRELRREIRHGLRSLGFCRLQQSVWFSPYDWEGEIDRIFRKLKIGEDVFVFKARPSKAKNKQLLKKYLNDSDPTGHWDPTFPKYLRKRLQPPKITKR